MATHWIGKLCQLCFLMPAQEFGGAVMTTISLKLVLYQKGFIFERVTKKRKKIKLMSGSTYLLFVFYTRTSHLKNTAPFFSRIHQHVQN